jgi:hypothetical protein
MFLGHIGVGLGAKRVAPRVSLGWLVAAPVLLDLLWPIFLLMGWESVRIDPGATVVTPFDFQSYPISHSLLTSIGWGVLLGGLYWMLRRDRGAALLIGSLVPSHWVLDWVVHRPDLPLYPGGARFGLGLWNSLPGTLVAEGLLFGAGVWLYASATRGPRLGIAVFASFLIAAYAGNVFGPPPDTVRQVAYVTLALWLLPLWAWSFDRRRTAV